MKFKNNFLANVSLVSLGLILGAGFLFAVSADNTQTYYQDLDGDQFGNSDIATTTDVQPEGYVLANEDCGDDNAEIYPGATEVYNKIDDNCDGLVDEGFIEKTFYIDEDGDTYGSTSSTTVNIEAPEGFVESNIDCNDEDADIFPGAFEIIDDEIDNNCDGRIDEKTFYIDEDGDGFGLISSTSIATTAPEGFVGNDGDCDDSDENINPDAIELYNQKDDDCDGVTDEGFVLKTYYIDEDGDGYGDDDISTTSIDRPSGYVVANGDCNDDNASINPVAVELDDNIDNNCDGQVDEGIENNDDEEENNEEGDEENENKESEDYAYDHNWDKLFEEDYQFRNHGEQVSTMAHYTNYLKKNGEISGKEKGQMMRSIKKVNKGKKK